MSRQGTLLIADISGYTAFLTQAELTHAQDILDSLIETLLAHLQPPLTVAKLEGDAIFCHAPDGTFLLGQSLLETVETAYCAFARALELMRIQTTCTCTACRMIPTLGLKFVVHHGEYLERQVGGRHELSGPAVIAVHRMLKNEVVERLGVKAYAFYSLAVLDALGIREAAEAMLPHAETYEHLGEVPGAVTDLAPVWQHAQAHERVAVADADLWFQLETAIPVPLPAAWDYFNDPTRIVQWVKGTSFTVTGKLQGRIGTGSVQHCAHGPQKTTMRIVDWLPFEYFAADTVGFFGGMNRWTVAFQPVKREGQPDATRMLLRVGRYHGRAGLHALFIRLVRPLLKPLMRKGFAEAPGTIAQLYAQDVAGGTVLPAPGPAPTRADLTHELAETA